MVFSRHVDAVVVALSWRRTVVIEQGRWESRRTSRKPHGDNVRDLRTVQKVEPEIEVEASMRRAGASMPKSKTHEVMEKHTYFEYEEFGWHKYRTFSASGDSPADVRWPDHALETDQRISERRETYHAKFAVAADRAANEDTAGDTTAEDTTEYTTELDETTWRTLRVGAKCRLTVGSFSDEVKQVTPPPKRDGRRH
jgi:hypothetical protein